MSMIYRKLTLHNFFVICIFVMAAIALYAGWRVFWFLTDDAYIFFRYVSNSMLGYGYTWNLPPFKPVEGYTSFLWVVLLDVVWRMTGVEPPDSANVLSLFFAYGTLFITILMLLKIELRPSLHKVRLLLVFIALVGILSNRTFLAWTSSGLETAVFNFFLILWVYIALFISPTARYWFFSLALVSVLAALTRPDGLLLTAASLFLITVGIVVQLLTGKVTPRLFWAYTPFLLLVAHFIWRKQVYGAWLPNTYAAKYVSAWPESGLRYSLSFIIEYALWFWLLLALVFLTIGLVRIWPQLTRLPKTATLDTAHFRSLVQLTVIGTFLLHFCYYTFIIGGDHFEYRVYSHLIVLIFVSSLWLLNWLRFSAPAAVAFMTFFVLFSWPIPWTHWTLSQPLTTREQTFPLLVAVAPQFPAAAQPYVKLFDELQFWLIEHGVAVRHQEHKVFAIDRSTVYPQRERAFLLAADQHPVFVTGAVGVLSWRFPTVNIIDWFGLNDAIVAHHPIDPEHFRYMAHDRFPPEGYARCFQPNLRLIADNKFVLAQREVNPETAIINCETRVWPSRSEYPSENIEDSTTDNFQVKEIAPEVENYLWAVWPADPSYIFFVPPTQKSIQEMAALQHAFAEYEGSGCMVLPPAVLSPPNPATESSSPRYMLTFLLPQNRPPLSELYTLFPWTTMVAEETAVGMPAYSYNLGYAAPVEAQTELMAGQTLSATWANNVAFLGYDLPENSASPGDTLYLTLYYRADAPLTADFNFFVHVLSDEGTTGQPAALVAQADGVPCQDLYPPDFWQPGTVLAHKVAIPVPTDLPAGSYTLQTGLYNWQTGERFPLIGSEADALTLADITIQP